MLQANQWEKDPTGHKIKDPVVSPHPDPQRASREIRLSPAPAQVQAGARAPGAPAACVCVCVCVLSACRVVYCILCIAHAQTETLRVRERVHTERGTHETQEL